MRRTQQEEARSSLDRDFQRQIGIAEAALRRALEVTTRAQRVTAGTDRHTPHKQRLQTMQLISRHLAAIKHLDVARAPDMDIQADARDLLRWLDRRQRLDGTPRKSGYQERLAGALRLLRALTGGRADDMEPLTQMPTAPIPAPEPEVTDDEK
jgi:hypothetical protein